MSETQRFHRLHRAHVYIFEHVSNRNPFEVFIITFFALSSLNYVFFGARPGQAGVETVVTASLAMFWNVVVMVCCIGILVSYLVRDFLIAELLKMWLFVAMAGSSCAYGLVFILAYGANRSLAGGWLIAIGLACLARGGQVFREIAAYRSELMRLRAEREDRWEGEGL